MQSTNTQQTCLISANPLQPVTERLELIRVHCRDILLWQRCRTTVTFASTHLPFVFCALTPIQHNKWCQGLDGIRVNGSRRRVRIWFLFLFAPGNYERARAFENRSFWLDYQLTNVMKLSPRWERKSLEISFYFRKYAAACLLACKWLIVMGINHDFARGTLSAGCELIIMALKFHNIAPDGGSVGV